MPVAAECDVVTEDDNKNRVKKRSILGVSPNTRRRAVPKPDTSAKSIKRKSPKKSRLAASTNREISKFSSTEPVTPQSSKVMRTRAVSQPPAFISERDKTLSMMDEHYNKPMLARKIRIKARSPDQFPNAQRLCPAGYILKAADCPG